MATHGNLFAVTDSGEAPAGGGGASQVYLLPPTQMANDPQPEVDVSLNTSGEFGCFFSAFGARGGIVGASFATALPGDPSLPNSTEFGDTTFGGESWMIMEVSDDIPKELLHCTPVEGWDGPKGNSNFTPKDMPDVKIAYKKGVPDFRNWV